MSRPVTTNQWAGNFDCQGPCRRKRLMGEEFSKKALERYRKDARAVLKCKQCVEDAQAAERAAAAARKATTESTASSSSEPPQQRVCAVCQKSLGDSLYNRNQWNKGEGKSKCRPCVDQALVDEKTQQEEKLQARLTAAKQRVAELEASGAKGPTFTAQLLKAEAELAALEAERVTGLKPTTAARGTGGRGRMGGRGGRGRMSGRSGGGGRGRGGGGRGRR